MGGGLLVQTVAAIEGGTARRTPQDPAQVTFAPMLSRELSPMDWSHPASRLHDQVRGLLPWPTASAELRISGSLTISRSGVPARFKSMPVFP